MDAIVTKSCGRATVCPGICLLVQLHSG